MKFGVNQKRVLFAMAVFLIAMGSFASGFISCLHEKRSVTSELRRQYLLKPGDAPPEARAGVLTALREFQAGYIKRDTTNLDAFMSRLFDRNGDVLVLGTDSAEWERGFPEAAQFIRTDWQNWGDVRFAVDDSIIWSSGDMAWVASVGDVRFKDSVRPMRFSATLTRSGDHWIFRQVQFQWDDSDPKAVDALRPGTYLNLMRLAFHRMARTLLGAGSPAAASKP